MEESGGGGEREGCPHFNRQHWGFSGDRAEKSAKLKTGTFNNDNGHL